jgi:hypothetical protein
MHARPGAALGATRLCTGVLPARSAHERALQDEHYGMQVMAGEKVGTLFCKQSALEVCRRGMHPLSGAPLDFLLDKVGLLHRSATMRVSMAAPLWRRASLGPGRWCAAARRVQAPQG